MKSVILSFVLLFFSFMYASDVVFIVSHPGPAKHFSEFAKVLEKEKISCRFLAKYAAFESLELEGFTVESIKDLSAKELAQKCEKDSLVITEVGDALMPLFHRKLKELFPSLKSCIYYDNPQEQVPGGYSEAFQSLLKEPVETVIFANPTLCHLTTKESCGLGYYPLNDLERLRHLRDEKQVPGSFLYIGGANTAYYTQGLPYFLKVLQETPLKGTRLLFQQHPRAKLEGNMDLKLIEEAREKLLKRGIEIEISTNGLIETAAKADFILYYQTSTSPLFILAGIPTFQVAPLNTQDILVKKGLALALSPKKSLSQAQEEEKKFGIDRAEKIKEVLGFSEKWQDNLLSIIKGKIGYDKKPS